MTLASGALAAGRAVLECLFPERCLVCGAWLDASGTDAICRECRLLLVPLSGRRCGKCGIPLVSEQGLCTRCRTSDFAFVIHRSLFSYTGAVKTLLAALKFSGRTRVSRLFADLLWESMDGFCAGLPIVPVPGRRRHDAVDVMARSLQARHGARIVRMLARAGGRPQKSLDFEERRRNLGGRIRVRRKPGQTIPADVVLLDDVFTTGATADACTRALLQAGCRRVSVVTIAMEE